MDLETSQEPWSGSPDEPAASKQNNLAQPASPLAPQGSAEQLRRAVEEAPVPTIMQAEDGQVLQISRSWTALTGYALTDIPTLDAWLSHAYGPGADAVRSHVRGLFAGEQPAGEVIFEIRTRTGDLRHWSFSASSPGVLSDGRRFVVGVAQDITERILAEQALAEQARLLDLSNDAIIIRDVNNRIIYWNRGATELYGWSREEAIGQDLHELLQTEFETPFDQLFAALHQRDRLEGEVVQVTRDGRRLTLLCRWALDRNNEGDPGAILTTYNDITERKRIEQALRDNERDFRAIFEGSSVGKAQVDPTTRRFLRVNAALSAMTGYSEAELLARSMDDLIYPDDRESDRKLFEGLIQRKTNYQLERRYVRKDGRLMWVTVTGNVIEAIDGQTIRTIAVIQDITARKQAEEALRVSEAKYRTLFETMDEGFCILQLIFDAEQRPVDYRYVEVNPAFERQTGMHNAIGRSIREMVPEIEPFWLDLYGSVALTGESARFVDYAAAMGRWFDVSAFRIGEPEKRRVAVLFTDITARKRREAHLAFLSEIGDEFARLSNADELMHTVGQKLGEYLHISSCVFADVDDARGKLAVGYAWNASDVPSLRRSFHITEYLTEEFARASRAGEMVVIRNTQTDPRTDAQAYAALDIGAFVTIPFRRNGVWTYYLGVTDRLPRDWRDDELELIEELSNRIFPRLERARAEAALRESEARFRLMADAVPQIVWLTDADGRVEFFNKQWSDYTGALYNPATAAEVAASFLHPDDAAPTLQAFEQARYTGVFAVEHRIRSAAGQYRWFLVRAEPYRDPQSGEIVRWFGASIDIHDRKDAEARLQDLYAKEQAARAQAEEASRLKDEFLATISHELRTPLTAFLGYAQLLQRGNRDAAYVSRTVDKMVQSAKAQAELIEDLLDVSRIVSGKLRIEPEPIELLDVISAALDTVRPAVEAKGLHIDVELEPAASAVMGDANRLQQVVWNLLSNATKFTPPGGRIAIRLAPLGESAELTVSDSGQGIRPDFLPHVFDRFRQADSTSHRVHGGLGLGLAIVRHLVELHGGTVEATSAGEGQGATFTVRLPLARASDLADRPVATAVKHVESDEGQFPLSGLRLIVVDDQATIAELLAEALTSYGATVRACTMAEEALALVRTWQPHVLVSDIAMPGKDGYWLMQQVRSLAPEEGRATPAVAVTAYVRVEDRLRVVAAGFQQYVLKPVEAAELRDVILSLASRPQEN